MYSVNSFYRYNSEQFILGSCYKTFRSPLITIDEEENIQLNKFLEQAVFAKNIDDLSKVVKQALNLGIKINAPNKDIIKKLALMDGAEFDFQFDEKTTEVCNKVKKEVEPQILDRLKKLREIGDRLFSPSLLYFLFHYRQNVT
ncbi:MAG: hypothetical protein KTV77_05585 [Wolbachia endosymbiont of Fragariocoptes setiger]|nr:hypothetical protein [Wolbachia endosymbiont of Fragariocoptes setiger]